MKDDEVASANLQLEQAKVSLQLVQERMRARSAASIELAAALNDLHNAFLSYITLVQFATSHGMEKGV
jgi:hypothetical protein